jgi:hypothetical protein
MRRPSVRWIVLIAAGCLVVAVAGAWHLGMFGDDTAWSMDLRARAFRAADVEAEVEAAVTDGDYRFAFLSGGSYSDTSAAVTNRYGTRWVATASDLDGHPPAHDRLVEAASDYATRYNDRLLVRLVPIERARIADLDAQLATDQEDHSSFDEAWERQVAWRYRVVQMQIVNEHQDNALDSMATHLLVWELIMLDARGRVVEAELEVRRTGYDVERRLARLEEIGALLDASIEEYDRHAKYRRQRTQ